MRVGRFAATLLALALILMGCQRTEEATTGDEREPVRIAVLMSNAGDPYFANKSYGYYLYEQEDPAVETRYFNAGGYDKLNVQLQQIEDAITQGFDVLAVTPVDARGVCGALQEAHDNGTVIVADDTGIECDFQVPLFATENSFQTGFEQCSFIAERQGGTGGMAAIWGPAGPAHIERRKQGCLAALESYPDIDLLVDQNVTTTGVDAGLTMTEDFLTRFGDQIKGIYTAGSVLAGGAAQALEGAGFAPGDVTLVGIDMTSESIADMQAGWLQGIQPAKPVRLAYTVMKYGAALARGETNVPGGEGVFPCCEKVVLMTDYMVVTPEIYQTFPTDWALAPEGWKPPT